MVSITQTIADLEFNLYSFITKSILSLKMKKISNYKVFKETYECYDPPNSIWFQKCHENDFFTLYL